MTTAPIHFPSISSVNDKTDKNRFVVSVRNKVKMNENKKTTAQINVNRNINLEKKSISTKIKTA